MVECSARNHKAYARHKDRGRGHEEHVRGAQHSRDTLIEQATERNAVPRAKANERERRLAHDDRRRRAAKLDGHEAKEIRNDVRHHHARRWRPQRTRSLHKRLIAKHAGLRKGESREGRPCRHAKDKPEVGARRRFDGREHDERQQERRERLHEIARTRDASLNPSSRHRCGCAEGRTEKRARERDARRKHDRAKARMRDEGEHIHAAFRAAEWRP